MRQVAVIGIGQTKVDEHWDKSLRELAGDAALAALADSGLDLVEAVYVGNMMSGSANRQQHLGAYIADWIGMRGAEAFRTEAACSSGAASFRTAVMAVASGMVNSALAVGVEKMTDSPLGEITAALATAADADWEAGQGLSFVSLNALLMRRYMHEFGWEKEHFAPFSVNAHANAMHNPHARFHDELTTEKYLKASMVNDPINLMDASPIGDGAAAAIVIPLELARRVDGHPTVLVAASSAATDTLAVQHRKDPLFLKAAYLSGKKAYEQAGITAQDVDLHPVADLEIPGLPEGRCVVPGPEHQRAIRRRDPQLRARRAAQHGQDRARRGGHGGPRRRHIGIQRIRGAKGRTQRHVDHVDGIRDVAVAVRVERELDALQDRDA